ncbi:hypothetical protein SY88_18880 [Clostridiales bacterium PH28_bin88]|nr:hypothetical protein SY88_18880 [Clostridiales bacterium PH28_bin88]
MLKLIIIAGALLALVLGKASGKAGGFNLIIQTLRGDTIEEIKSFTCLGTGNYQSRWLWRSRNPRKNIAGWQ